jgi:hypothetical protein
VSQEKSPIDEPRNDALRDLAHAFMNTVGSAPMYLHVQFSHGPDDVSLSMSDPGYSLIGLLIDRY